MVFFFACPIARQAVCACYATRCLCQSTNTFDCSREPLALKLPRRPAHRPAFLPPASTLLPCMTLLFGPRLHRCTAWPLGSSVCMKAHLHPRPAPVAVAPCWSLVCSPPPSTSQSYTPRPLPSNVPLCHSLFTMRHVRRPYPLTRSAFSSPPQTRTSVTSSAQSPSPATTLQTSG